MTAPPLQPAHSPDGVGLYLHIPFCEKKCHYCDFNTYAGMSGLITPYVAALRQEIARWGQALTGPNGPTRARTIFLGGGTPSLLTPEQLASVLDACRAAFALAPDAEVTMEANPGTISTDLLRGFHDAGINRVSMGAQSFNAGELEWLGRIHSVAGIGEAIQNARAAGFTNLNLDLIYGLPRQPLERWETSLREVLAIAPEHISAYALTVEEGTPLGRWVDEGKVPLPDPDLAADMYLATEAALGAAGYEHYEISNWAKPGRACRHNLIYWENEPWIGCGAGAHSFLPGLRFADVRLPNHYLQQMRRLAESPVPDLSWAVTQRGVTEEQLKAVGPVTMLDPLDRRMERGETMMLALRLAQGLDPAVFAGRFGESLDAAFGDTIRELEGWGLLEWNEGRLRLTDRGRLLGNEVFVRFLGD
ncbi:MAG: radical SAM family heme chaperone HemW [Chloroflexi bacterium]|nr:radical SAM family heme chaperone HemW [Chloroflexota bacterium]